MIRKKRKSDADADALRICQHLHVDVLTFRFLSVAILETHEAAAGPTKGFAPKKIRKTKEPKLILISANTLIIACFICQLEFEISNYHDNLC